MVLCFSPEFAYTKSSVKLVSNFNSVLKEENARTNFRVEASIDTAKSKDGLDKSDLKNADRRLLSIIRSWGLRQLTLRNILYSIYSFYIIINGNVPIN